MTHTALWVTKCHWMLLASHFTILAMCKSLMLAHWVGWLIASSIHPGHLVYIRMCLTDWHAAHWCLLGTMMMSLPLWLPYGCAGTSHIRCLSSNSACRAKGTLKLCTQCCLEDIVVMFPPVIPIALKAFHSHVLVHPVSSDMHIHIHTHIHTTHHTPSIHTAALHEWYRPRSSRL